MSSESYVTYEVIDSVAEIVMNRAPVNAINHDLARQVIAAYGRAKDDPSARAVILTSAFGKVFSAGLDLKLAVNMNGQGLREFLEVFYYEMHEAQYRMGKPTIAAVTGHARAAGVTWAVSCDMIVASEDAEFAYPEINVGLIPAMHVVHLPREIGRHRAAELLFTGDTISARALYEYGVINYVVPAAEVLPKARELARRVTKKSPIGIKLLRDAFMRANDLGYRREMESVVETTVILKESEDSKAALRAFVEKRQPIYKGR
jgi:enoyl-CoA hydratase/carnithine racemase